MANRLVTLHKSNSEAGVAVLSNAANQLTPIIRVTTPKSRIYAYPDGAALILKLAVTGGASITALSTLILSARRPTQRRGSDITGTYVYAAWFNIPLTATSGEKTQYDSETTTHRRIFFNQGGDYVLPQDWVMEVLLDATTVVDWTEGGSTFEWTISESDVVTQVAA